MVSKYSKYIIFFIGIVLGGYSISRIGSCNRPHVKTPFNVSLDHIKEIKELHLLKYYFEEVIPIDRKDKLKALLIAQATVNSYINMSDVIIDSDSTGLIKITIPEIKLSAVNFFIDSAKVYDFNHFGVHFSDNAYGEAIDDIQQGIRKARVSINIKCMSDGIVDRSRLAAEDWFYNWAKLTNLNVVINHSKN